MDTLVSVSSIEINKCKELGRIWDELYKESAASPFLSKEWQLSATHLFRKQRYALIARKGDKVIGMGILCTRYSNGKLVAFLNRNTLCKTSLN